MKKKLLSIMLAFSMLLTLLPPTAQASVDQILNHYPAPTNPRWEGHTLDWDWSGEKDSYFKGFQVTLYTCDLDRNTVPTEETDWNYYMMRNTYGISNRITIDEFSYYGSPATNRWYCFEVCAYGESSEWITPENGEPYEYMTEYLSPNSVRSAPFWYEAAAPLSAPTNLGWNGPTMMWTMSDPKNVEAFELQVLYDHPEYGEMQFMSSWPYAERNQTVFSRSILEVVDEDFLYSEGDRSYYFRVRAISEDTSIASDSDWAYCYSTCTVDTDAPRLDAPAGMEWVDYTMQWDLTEGLSYDVDLYYQRTEPLTDEERAEIGAGGDVSEEIFSAYITKQYRGITEFPSLDNSSLNYYAGDYWFKVRAVSSDLSENRSSDWSAESGKLSIEEQFKLPIPADPHYDESADTIVWSWSADADQQKYLSCFAIELYYRPDTTTEPQAIGWIQVNDGRMFTDEWKEYAEADGLYSFRVLAESSNFNKYERSDWSPMSSEFTFKLPDPLPTPTNVSIVGSVLSWTPLADGSLVDTYEIVLLYCGENGNAEPEACHYLRTGSECSEYCLAADDFSRGEGTYQIGVRARSRDIDQASNSAIAMLAAPFVYIMPEARLAAPGNLRWEENTMKWDVPENTAGIGYYEVEYYGVGYDWFYSSEAAPGKFVTLARYEAQALGDQITFRVRAISNDVNAALDSEWVECAQLYVPPAGLDVPTDLAWDGNDMTWSWNGDRKYLDYLVVYLYYAASAGEKLVYIGPYWSENDGLLEYEQWAPAAPGPGLYYFSVRAMSNDPNTIENSKESDMSAPLRYSPPEKLAAPGSAAWDGCTCTWTPSSDEENECMDGYSVRLYYVNGKSREKMDERFVGRNSSGYQFPSSSFRNNGNYVFGVCAMTSDPTGRSNSDEVMSETVFTYTKPSASLAAPTGLYWDGITMKWDVPEDTSAISAYSVTAEGLDTGKSSSFTLSPGRFRVLSASNLTRLGNRIKFRVQALSGDVNRFNDSPWSEYSEVLTINGKLKLSAPANLTYTPSTGMISWSSVSSADYYVIEVFYSETEDGEQKCILEGETGYNAYHFVDTVGLGWYHVKVRAVSENDLFSDSDWSSCSAQFSGIVPLGAPSELSWGREVSVSKNGGLVWREVPGVCSWKRGHDQGFYHVHVYRVNEGQGKDEEVASFGTWNASLNSEYLSEPAFLMGDEAHRTFESGTYYFTVQAVGDDINYASGPVVTSENWVYEKPETQLPAVSGTAWKGSRMIWELPEDTSAYYGYETEVYFSVTADGEPELVGGNMLEATESMVPIPSYVIEEWGNGCYWFRIRGISIDITEACSSQWTALCGPYRLDVDSAEVNDSLIDLKDALEDESVTAEELAEAIAEELEDAGMSLEDLANAMTADDGSAGENGTLSLISELEELTGVTTDIAVDDSVADTLPTEEISVVGAGLNAGSGSSVTLSIDAAEEDIGDIIPNRYTSALQFSMHLEGGVDTDGGETGNQQLAIPVCITLPIPAGINPAFLVILHRIGDSDYEVLQPYIYQESGKWFASFTVTSFSDFAMASVSITAARGARGVDVSLVLGADLPGVVYCVAYGEGNRFLGVVALTQTQVAAGERTVTVPCNSAEAVRVKLFVLDGDNTPMFVETSCGF